MNRAAVFRIQADILYLDKIPCRGARVSIFPLCSKPLQSNS
ncbi:hypothetical protein ABIE52_006937 [Rhodococcus sp. OAS809]